jgi:SPP1 family predicted phage head-tail adaptor
MLAGPLDRRVIWKTATTSISATGNDSRTWSTAFETWAHKAKLSGAETVAALETVDEATVKLEIRWRPNIAPGADVRFEFEGKSWRVVSVEEIGRREGLAIVGRTRSDGGEVPG